MSPARALALAALLAASAGVGLISVSGLREQLDAHAVCDAAAAGDWERALALPPGPLPSAAECRCRALLATGAGARCAALLERVLADPSAADWTPQPRLAVHLIQTRREAGRPREAADLARRAAARHPDDSDLFYLELMTRSAVEDEEAVLRELEARPRLAPRMRVSLANRHLQRGDARRALRALGERPPPDDAARARWFETRGMAHASAGDLAGLRRSYAEWEHAGGDPAELRARYAVTLSIAGLADPDHAPSALLRRALEDAERIADPVLHETLIVRLILTLVNEGAADEALALYDRGRERFGLSGLTREELERSADHRRSADAPGAPRAAGRLRFEIEGAPSGAVLLLSPDAGAPADADYERVAVPASGRVTVARTTGGGAQRWVLRDAEGRTLGSGTAHLRGGEEIPVAVRAGTPRAHARVALARGPADGRGRAVLLLLDCADWPLVQYLRARGELPALDALLRGGFRAVLHSDPPLTAAALEALVWPGPARTPGTLGFVHQLGTELAGLASIGDNPFGALAWLLPERQDLFAVVGAGERVAANMLFAHGGIRAGRHSELTGPRGARRRLRVTTSARDLDPAERARWPELAALREERDAVHLRAIAAELDAAEQIAGERRVDLLALRVEPLDILTHAHFAGAVRSGQDDGRGLLFSVYRYIDARIAALHDHLDADDYLVVMSDHGIRTAMEHSRDAIFVVAGPGVPVGRAAGRPALAGVPRVLADLLGVRAQWPDTGVAPWAAALRRDGPGSRRLARP